MKWIIFLALFASVAFILFRRTASSTTAGKSRRPTTTSARKTERSRSGNAQSHRGQIKPFAAKEIKAGAKACEAALALAGKRFLVSEVPSLPLEGCDQTECKCQYLRHDDRRDGNNDRRLPNSLSSQLYNQGHEERRSKPRGRRKTD